MKNSVASILVVDDSPTERIRVSGLLNKQSEYSVITAGCGDEALEKIAAQQVDLVLTDLQMPGMDGLELVRHLTNKEPQLPVILMTGAGSEEIAVQAMTIGAASYVNKKSSSSWMMESVEQVLAARVEALANAELLSRMLADEYELLLGNSRTLMCATARFLRQAIQAVGLCQTQELPRLGIALEEALLNACLHGNLGLDSRLREGDGSQFEILANQRAAECPWKDRQVQVVASITPQQMKVRITDEGSGFDPGKLPDPTDPENLLKPHGRGVMMMRMFLDEVQWNESGNSVTLIKNGSPS